MLERRNPRAADTVWRVRTIRGIQANQNMEDIDEKRCNNPFCSKQNAWALGCVSATLCDVLNASHAADTCHYYWWHQFLSPTNPLIQAVGYSWTKSPQLADFFFFFCKVKICQHYGEGLGTEIIGKEAACFLQECSALLSGEQGVSVISKSKPNKVNQPNLFQGHSGFPQAIKMFKPLNISDLFSCIPHLQLTCTLKVRWNHYLILILPRRLHLQAL